MRHFIIFKQYNWLIDIISRKGGLTLSEIQDLWLDSSLSEGKSYARSTFNRHREEILELFDIEIVCRKIGDEYKYFIDDSDGRSVPQWMASTMKIQNMLEEFSSIKDRIILENIPTEGDILRNIAKAMAEKRKITVTYQRYESDEAKTYTVEPLCLKQYARRWYVLVRYPKYDSRQPLGLDRIKNLEVADTHFDMPADFDASEYFKHSFGIAKDDTIPSERIIFRAYDTERRSLLDLPIHPSQRLLSEHDYFSEFEINISPTRDFFGYVLSRGGYLRIMEPQWVIDEIGILAKNILDDCQAARRLRS